MQNHFKSTEDRLFARMALFGGPVQGRFPESLEEAEAERPWKSGIHYPARDLTQYQDTGFQLLDKAARAAGVEWRYGEDEVGYNWSTNILQMAHREAFASAADYAYVIAHELTHSTMGRGREHLVEPVVNELEKRWPPFWIQRLPKFRRAYASEELVAELGAMLLADAAGAPTDRLLNAGAEYLSNWLVGSFGSAESQRAELERARPLAEQGVDWLLQRAMVA